MDRVRTLGGSLGVVAVLLALCVADVSAQAGRREVDEGNRLYGEGLFAEAHQRYLEALAESPESSLIRFNDGNALYQSADYQRAMEAYQQAVESGDPELASAAWYNFGNALYREQQLQQSLEAYKQALRLNPSDPDAKHNLERVLEQIQQQEQEQQQDGDQSQDPQEGENEENQRQQPGDQETEESDQNQQPQDPGQEPQEREQPPQDASDQEQEQDAQAQPQPQPGQMTPEEAQRLLDAIEEDPGDVNRKPVTARGRKPRRPW